MLAQDDVGGLQVKHTHEDGEIYWVDAKPLPGALVINVGDLLQVTLCAALAVLDEDITSTDMSTPLAAAMNDVQGPITREWTVRS